MNALLNRLITDATAPIGKISARLFKQAALFFVAMSCLFVSSIFMFPGWGGPAAFLAR
jgi:hypothetical protein